MIKIGLGGGGGSAPVGISAVKAGIRRVFPSDGLMSGAECVWMQQGQKQRPSAWAHRVTPPANLCAAAPFAHRYINIMACGGDGVQTAACLQTAHKHLPDTCVFVKTRTTRLDCNASVFFILQC